MVIRFAEENDIDDIMLFIDLNWKKGHILGNNKNFFHYEHLDGERVSYAIAKNDNGDIEGILGYIPYGKTNRDIMTVMWKVLRTSDPSLGLNLFKFIKDNADVRIMASPGSNPKLRGLYKYLGYDFGEMTQWYRLSNKEEFHIASIYDNSIPTSHCPSFKYRVFSDWNDFAYSFDYTGYIKSNPKPLKEMWYIKKRYFDHPIYKYIIAGLVNQDEKIVTAIILRKVEKDMSCAIRFIDCIGNINDIKYSTKALDEIMDKYNAEYVDCYEVGVNEEVFLQSGWKKTKSTNNIIPNYFSPFVKENINIYYFSSDSDIVLFKGDGDQDRPN